MTDAIDILETWEASNKLVADLTNRSALRIFLGRLKEAIDDCSAALRMEPKYALALRNRGVAEHLQNDFRSAISDFQGVLIAGTEAQDIIPKLANCFLADGKPSSAIEVIQQYFPQDKIDESDLEPKLILVQAYDLNQESEKASQLLNQLQEAFPNHPQVLSVYARHSIATGKEEEAGSYLTEALNYSDEIQRQFMSIQLGDYYYRKGQYQQASQLYRPYVNTSVDNDLLKHYLTCLYYGRDYTQCLAICEDIRKNNGITEYISEIEASIQWNLGNIARAGEIYLELSKKYPNRHKYLVNYMDRELRGSG